MSISTIISSWQIQEDYACFKVCSSIVNLSELTSSPIGTFHGLSGKYYVGETSSPVGTSHGLSGKSFVAEKKTT